MYVMYMYVYNQCLYQLGKKFKPLNLQLELWVHFLGSKFILSTVTSSIIIQLINSYHSIGNFF